VTSRSGSAVPPTRGACGPGRARQTPCSAPWTRRRGPVSARYAHPDSPARSRLSSGCQMRGTLNEEYSQVGAWLAAVAHGHAHGGTGGVAAAKGGAQSQAGVAGAAPRPPRKYTIAMVTTSRRVTPSGDKIRAGAQDAAAKLNVDLKYSNNENGPEQATSYRTPSTARWRPRGDPVERDAVIPWRRAADAGIPVVVFNRASTSTSRPAPRCTSARTRTRRPDRRQRISSGPAAPARRCAHPAQGSVALETRCAGVKKTDPNTENLQATAPTCRRCRRPSLKLQQDKSITSVVTLGARSRWPHCRPSDRGAQAKIVTFDLSPDAAKASRAARLISPSTSSPTCRATWRSPRCG